jgi:glycosyltransferase involved in cell wall biosynthesis
MSKTIEQPSAESAVPQSKHLPGPHGEGTTNRVEARTGGHNDSRSGSVGSGTGIRVCAISSSRNALEQRMFLKEATSLAQAGYRVSVVAPHTQDEVISGITIKAVPKFTSRLSRMVRTTWYVYREGLRQKAQVYHFHNTELIPVGWLLKLQGKRVIYDVREDTPADIRDRFYIPRWIRPVVAGGVDIAEKLSGRFLDGIVAATAHIGERFPHKNTAVVQNFPLLDESSPESRPYLGRDPVVLYIGTITPVRGLLELVEAMGLLPEGLPARLAIGGQFDPPELEQAARQKPGWQRTDHAGWQNRHGLLDMLGKARVGVVPFLPAANHTDCQPTKLFEYMIAGLPVVATSLLQLGKIVNDAQCGILVEPGNPQAMADAIQWLLEHPEEARAMGERGRQAILQTYNWNSQAQVLLQLYRRVTA